MPDLVHASFSEQAAIDFVDLLVDSMIKGQRFRNRLPTVGGEIHLALITKRSDFQWISKEDPKEEYTSRGHPIPKHTR